MVQIHYACTKMRLNQDNVLIVDDLLATGGTVEATVAIEQLGGAVGCAFLIELEELNGRKTLEIMKFIVNEILRLRNIKD